jgi:predicted SnoaL-like aldol condensation-catalyzing enzyme
MYFHTKFASPLAGAALAAAMMSSAHADAGGLTEVNRVTMRAFIETAYGQKQVRRAYETYADRDLIQHNPNIADGREAAVAELEGLLKNPAAHFDVQHVVVDGDLAAVHFRGSLGGGAGAAVVELFRLKDGKIVEHWDAFQVMDPKLSAHNAHPYF